MLWQSCVGGRTQTNANHRFVLLFLTEKFYGVTDHDNNDDLPNHKDKNVLIFKDLSLSCFFTTLVFFGVGGAAFAVSREHDFSGLPLIIILPFQSSLTLFFRTKFSWF